MLHLIVEEEITCRHQDAQDKNLFLLLLRVQKVANKIKYKINFSGHAWHVWDCQLD